MKDANLSGQPALSCCQTHPSACQSRLAETPQLGRALSSTLRITATEDGPKARFAGRLDQAAPPKTKPLAPRDPAAFTLLELLVILGVLALLALTFLPALARTAAGSRGFQCLNNHRQLCAAWRMYADDNHDRIVYASDDGTGAANPQNQYTWTLSHLDSSPNNRQNWDITADITQRPLWPYTGRNAAIYRCPSDPSYVVVSGVSRPRVRSVSMNMYLGGFAGTTGGWPFANGYRLFFKTTELTAPGPAKTFVFTDIRPDAVTWGNFATDMSGYSPRNPSVYQFQDYPGLLHDSGCSFSFADGHTETHRWTDPRTVLPMGTSVVSPAYSPGNLDIAWLQDHATRPQ